jgi:DnaK suppressor protein
LLSIRLIGRTAGHATRAVVQTQQSREHCSLASKLPIDQHPESASETDSATGTLSVARRATGIMAITTTTASITESRYQSLKAMLEERRRELVREVHFRIRDARAENVHEHGVLDEGETSDIDIQEEIGFTLIEMKTETLEKIKAALRRIDEGTYGVCYDCGDAITERRLRALPFALRCRDCEETREMAERQERITARRNSSSPFFEVSS